MFCLKSFSLFGCGVLTDFCRRGFDIQLKPDEAIQRSDSLFGSFAGAPPSSIMKSKYQ
jgi:hypothetical protein